MAKNVLRSPGRAVDTIATAAASRNLKKVILTLPELIKFLPYG